LHSWNTLSVTDMSFMFSGAAAFNQDLSSWETLRVVDMNSMFHEANEFNRDVSTFDVSNVLNFDLMFQGASTFNQSLCVWGSGISNSAEVREMFKGTACPIEADPVIESSGFSPLCHSCISRL